MSEEGASDQVSNAHSFRDWNSENDGDYWGLFWKTLCKRGTGSTAFTWVRGHTWEKTWALGKAHTTVSRQDSYGNSVADTMADLGAAVNGKARVAEYVGRRHDRYCKLMARIRKYIVGAMKLDRELREQEQALANPLKGADIAHTCLEDVVM